MKILKSLLLLVLLTQAPAAVAAEGSRWSFEIGAGSLWHIPHVSARAGYRTDWLGDRLELQGRYALLLPNLLVPRPEMGTGHGLSLGGRYYFTAPEAFWRPYIHADLAGMLVIGASMMTAAEALLLGAGSEWRLSDAFSLGASISSGIAAVQGYYAPPVMPIPPLLEVSCKYRF